MPNVVIVIQIAPMTFNVEFSGLSRCRVGAFGFYCKQIDARNPNYQDDNGNDVNWPLNLLFMKYLHANVVKKVNHQIGYEYEK